MKTMTYKEACALVRKKAAAKYGDSLAARLNYLVGGFFEKGSRDITHKTADRKVQTLRTRFACSEKQLRRILEKLEEIEVQQWRNRKVEYKFNPASLLEFDLDHALRESESKDKRRLERQAERMRERRAAERQRQKSEELLLFLEQYKDMSVEELIRTIKERNDTQESNSVKGDNAKQ